jgi:hypothetical protein
MKSLKEYFIQEYLFKKCSVLVEDNCDKIRNGEWKERPYAWNPVS